MAANHRLRLLATGFFVASLVGLVAFVATFAGVGGRPPQAHAASSTSFVTHQGSILMVDGHPLVLRGFTFYPADFHGGASWERTDFPAYLHDKVFVEADQSGSNLYRTSDQTPTGAPLSTWQNPQLWVNTDYLVAQAQLQHRYVLLDLSFMYHLLKDAGKDTYDPALWYPLIDFAANRYKDATSIAAVEFKGEPMVPYNQADYDHLYHFYASVIARWKATDPNHLTSTGGLTALYKGFPTNTWWQGFARMPGNDLFGFKTYTASDVAYLPTVEKWMSDHGIPLLQDEFGMRQEFGDTVWSGYTRNGLAESRVSFYTWMYGQADQYRWAMTIFWNADSGISPTSDAVNVNTPGVWSVVKANAPPPIGGYCIPA
jgi:hypothetical protein